MPTNEEEEMVGDMEVSPLTAAELAEIEARCEAATPGPWKHDPDTAEMAIDGPREEGVVAGCGCCGSPFGVLDNTVAMANGTFIAHARTDVPRLLAEVRRLRMEPGKR